MESHTQVRLYFSHLKAASPRNSGDKPILSVKLFHSNPSMNAKREPPVGDPLLGPILQPLTDCLFQH